MNNRKLNRARKKIQLIVFEKNGFKTSRKIDHSKVSAPREIISHAKNSIPNQAIKNNSMVRKVLKQSSSI